MGIEGGYSPRRTYEVLRASLQFFGQFLVTFLDNFWQSHAKLT